ncbi:MAG: response regulator transcription factor [Candidatus Scalindua sp.]|jgi:DNA-binding NarL/FixJ family response regulator|nr:response regulator transcription factor [Candidatus Scalindua sp.]
MKILIADDHPIILEGLRQIITIDSSDDIKVNAAETCKSMLEQLSDGSYDLLLLDINMPDAMGLDTLAEIKENHPNLPVLVLSLYPEDQYAIIAIKMGADGYIEKKSAPAELIRAIKQVFKKEKYISPSLALRLAHSLGDNQIIKFHEKLSSREFQVMRMLVEGEGIKSIAGRLVISPKTVSTYRSRILQKLGLQNNAELIKYAVKNDFIS